MITKFQPKLILETDPDIIRLFGGSQKELTAPTEEELAAYYEYAERMRAKADTEPSVDFSVQDGKHDPILTNGHCSWGRNHIARLFTMYISWYKRPPSKNRTYFLAQLEEIARENNIALPSKEMLNSRKPKKRMVVEAVDLNRTDLYKLKVYSDGENLVAYLPGENKAQERELHARSQWDDLFDALYSLLKNAPENSEQNATTEKKKSIRDYIEAELVRQFYEIYGYDDNKEYEPCPLFIARKLWNMTASFHERKKRFYRKKDQVKWTAWWTITYDDSKFNDETEFKKKLLNYFRNKANRAGWRVMGVFEHGKENGRLHFHGFFYIPEGTEVGELEDRKHWSEKDHSQHEYKANTKFEELFGINEYEDIRNESEAGKDAYAKYTQKMLSYMNKGEKIFYSRHIPSEFDLEVYADEIMCFFTQIMRRKVKRCVLWDDSFIKTDMSIIRVTERNPDKELLLDIGLIDEAA